MKKKVEDVVPKKSIRDIDVPRRGRDLEPSQPASRRAEEIKRVPKYAPKEEDSFVRPVSINNHVKIEDEPIKIETPVHHHAIKPPVLPPTDFKYEYHQNNGKKSSK